MSECDMTEDPVTVVHETASAQFYIGPLGTLSARVKATGNTLPSNEMQLLLLLDIAQSLADIRLYGVDQHQDYGQKTWVAP